MDSRNGDLHDPLLTLPLAMRNDLLNDSQRNKLLGMDSACDYIADLDRHTALPIGSLCYINKNFSETS